MSDESEAPDSTPAVESRPEPPSPASLSDEKWNSAVASWLDTHARNSPLAQYTEAWNYLTSAIHRLRDYL